MMNASKTKKKAAKKLPKITKQENTTAFTVKKKIGKPFKVEVPNEMLNELKNEYMGSTVIVGGGAYDKIKKYLVKKYGGSMGKNKYVYKALEKIDKHARKLAENEKKNLPKMDRIAALVISNKESGTEVILIDIPVEDSKKIKTKSKKNPGGAREDLELVLSYLGYPVNDVILDNAIMNMQNGSEAPLIDVEGNKHAMNPYAALQLAKEDAKKVMDFVQNSIADAKKNESYVKKAEYYIEKAGQAYAAGNYTYAKILAVKAMQSVKISKAEATE